MPGVNNSETKNILLLTYWYPPGVGAAAERIASFAAYLPEHEWNVYVVCADRGAHHAADSADDRMSVVRVPDPMAGEGPIFADYDPRQPGTPAWKQFLKRFVFPDRFVRWRKAAEQAASGLIANTKFDLILATFPPASTIQLALALHDQTGASLVLDFRDRWIGPGGYEPSSQRVLEKHRALEREAVRKAAAVIAVSQNMADAIAAENGIDAGRVHVVPNGYEPIADWEGSSPDADGGESRDKKQYLSVAHVGTVIPRNQPEIFFQSVSTLKGDSRFADLRFRFVGNLSADYVRSIGLEDLVETTGLVDRDTARREMRDADALLLLVGDYVGQWGHNAKVFEYVQAGRPILCLEASSGSNDGALLKRFVPDRLFVARLGDVEATATAVDALRSYIASRPNSAIELHPDFRAYSRRELSGRLAEVLDSCR